MSKFNVLREVKREADNDDSMSNVQPIAEPISPSPALSETPPQKKRGRPPGKRSSNDHEQITAYILRDTHLKVQMALLQDGKQQDFSELVESLLSQWLKSRN